MLESEELLKDYSCPAVKINYNETAYIDMEKPIKKMFDKMKLGELSTLLDLSPMLDLTFDSVMTSAKIKGIFDKNYDGGNFC